MSGNHRFLSLQEISNRMPVEVSEHHTEMPEAMPTTLDPEEPVPSSSSLPRSGTKETEDLQQELAEVRGRHQNTLKLYSALEQQCAQLQKELESKWGHSFEVSVSSLNLTHITNSILASPPLRGAHLTDPRLAKLRLATSTPAAPLSFEGDSLEGVTPEKEGVTPLSSEKVAVFFSAMKDRILKLEHEKASLERKLSETTILSSGTDDSLEGILSEGKPSKEGSRRGEEEEEVGNVGYRMRFKSLQRVKSSLVGEVGRLKHALQQSSAASTLNVTLQQEVTRLTEENLVSRSHSSVMEFSFPTFA